MEIFYNFFSLDQLVEIRTIRNLDFEQKILLVRKSKLDFWVILRLEVHFLSVFRFFI